MAKAIKTWSGRRFILPTAEEDAAIAAGIAAGIAADPDTYELSDQEMKTLRPRHPQRLREALLREAVDKGLVKK